MTNTQWSDISEFQVPVDNSYPYHFICIRSNDGSYQDHHFTQNIAWARAALKSGRIWGFMVYYFYRPGFDGAKLLMQRVGKPDGKMVAMIDVEGARGQVSGNQSGAINAQFGELSKWLGNSKRVVGYGNTTDLNALWPQKPKGIRIIVAAYGSNPGYPGKFAHQYMDDANTRPFGPSDLNSADGMSQGDLEKMFGFVSAAPENVHAFDGKQTMLDIAKSRNYGDVSSWLAHESALGTDVGAKLIGFAEKELAAIVPPAGTEWLTNP
jgi:hypothetical protein